MPLPTLLEHFGNYCVVSNLYDDEFDIHAVHTGGEDDFGTDGIAIVINGALVSTIEEAEELLSLNRYLDVEFAFIQAKTSASFDGKSMTSFSDGVLEFFSEDSSWRVNDHVQEKRDLMNWIYTKTAHFRRGKPNCSLHYISLGKWENDSNLVGRIERAKSKLDDTLLFRPVRYTPYGAEALQNLWTKSKNSVNASFEISKRITLSATSGIQESYLGVITVDEFLGIISDEQGLRRGIFIDNVRDFQGDNPVNSKMSESLHTTEGRDRFALLNNGITLVARELTNVADRFEASDFQIVNGCQSSHVLYNCKDELDRRTEIPIKVIATDDEDVISSIATATNSQTAVKDEDLWALERIHKRIEEHFATFEGKKTLFYERRSRQYSSVPGIEKVRIVPKALLARSFASMFRNDPHRASRYYSSLKASVGTNIFADDHRLEPYYTSSYTYYRLEYFFRNGQVHVKYKPARYHLMMLFRLIAAGKDIPRLNSGKVKAYVERIDYALWSDRRALQIFLEACSVIDEVQGDEALSGEVTKTQSFTDEVLQSHQYRLRAMNLIRE